MKQKYEKPAAKWIDIRSKQSVAEVCWGYVSSGQEFYHDIPGYGYAIMKVYADKKGCKGDIYFTVEFSNAANMTSEQIAKAQAYIDKVAAHAKAESAAGNPSPYKKSPFNAGIDSTWS